MIVKTLESLGLKAFNYLYLHIDNFDFLQVFMDTGKSFSEALILASTNPQYNKRLFIELPVQHMKTTSAEHTL